MEINKEEVYRVKYISNNNACGFKKNHEYFIKIDRDRFSYIIDAIEDITEENDEIHLRINVSNEKSIHRYFKFIKEKENK